MVGKFDGVPTEPLFEMEHVDKRAARTENGRKPLRAVAYGYCSQHRAPRPIALVRAGGHLVWREHDFPTWGNARMTCRGSGIRLCESPARDVAGETRPTCDCED